MFLKDTDILEKLTDSTTGKKVVSIEVAKELENKVNLYFSDKSSLVTEIDKKIISYIKDKLNITDTFPVTQPEENKLYLYNNKVYKLIGHSPIKKLITGLRNSFVILEDGSVYFAGYNANGDGGFDGDTTVKKIHTKLSFSQELLPIGDNIVDIVTDMYSTQFLTKNGNIIVCGLNTDGCLGIGNATKQTTKVKNSFSFPSKVKKIVVGGTDTYCTTFYLLEDGKIYSCGTNAHGQCGTDNTTVSHTPVDITDKFNSKVVDVSTGSYTTNGGSTIFLTEKNELFVVGYNAQGQLGQGNTTNSVNLINIPVPDSKKVTHISCDGGIISFVLNKREIYSSGYNAVGAIGNGNTVNLNTFTLVKTFEEDIKEFKHYSYNAGGVFSVVLLENGTVYTCGYNQSGQLGLLHATNIPYYTRINCDKKIKQIGTTYRGLSMLDYNGNIINYGNNDQYQLGTGETGSATNGYKYSVLQINNIIKSSYEKPDEDFIQVL